MAMLLHSLVNILGYNVPYPKIMHFLCNAVVTWCGGVEKHDIRTVLLSNVVIWWSSGNKPALCFHSAV